MVEITENEGPLSTEELDSVEKQLGVRFPDDYRSFMLKYNGGRTEPDGFAISWSDGQNAGDDWKTSTLSWLFFVFEDLDEDENLLTMNLETFSGRIPEDTVAVGRDAGGNLILLVVTGENLGSVLFWVKAYEAGNGRTPGYDNVGIVADSFEEFLGNKLY